MKTFVFSLLAAGAVFAINAATPAKAADFKYCLQGRDTGIPGDCQYRSYAECMTTASGRGAYCAINPRFAFAQQRRNFQ